MFSETVGEDLLQLREEIRFLKIECDVLRGYALLLCCVKLKYQF